MNPNKQDDSQKVTQADEQDKTAIPPQTSRESVDSVTGQERSSIKGIIKIDINVPELENPELARLKSKIVSFSSYDDCFNRGSVPSKSVQVNLDDDTIPDKAIIERRLSKLEEERNSVTDIAPLIVPNPPDDKKPVDEPAEKKQAPEAEQKQAPEAERKQAPEAEKKQAPEAEKSEQPTAQVEEVHEDKPASTAEFEKKDENDLEGAKISEAIGSMRPDPNIPRQFVIVEYIEHFYIDDNEDPCVMDMFERHHNVPNLTSIFGKLNQTKGQCTVPVTESVVKVFDSVNQNNNTDQGQGTSEQKNNAEPVQPTSSQHTSVARKKAINKNNKSKHLLKNNKSNKILKNHQQAKKSINANRNNSKGSKSRIHSENRKSEKKKRK